MGASMEKMFQHRIDEAGVHFAHKDATLIVTKDWWLQECRPFEITVTVEATF